LKTQYHCDFELFAQRNFRRSAADTVASGGPFVPPDTNGAAGATEFVEWVNVTFEVFDKGSGAVVMGPTPGNTFWKGFGGSCETHNDGDIIIQYDKARRSLDCGTARVFFSFFLLRGGIDHLGRHGQL
jgi:hypothetical protein